MHVCIFEYVLRIQVLKYGIDLLCIHLYFFEYAYAYAYLIRDSGPAAMIFSLLFIDDGAHSPVSNRFSIIRIQLYAMHTAVQDMYVCIWSY